MDHGNDAYTKQDREIRAFLREIRNGQVMCHAVWANEILERKDRTITEYELEKLFEMGF